ncbi:MAG: pyridoxamine 5'-phosphate oxidase family protein [Sulfurospirillum sp.]|nr:pyridoxamine 5'-phosphate oxidase family protein [Sulfurospirillum sp.]
MRRSEFDIKNHEALLELLASCEYGTLCLSDEKTPYGVPLNFAWWEEGIVFHGAKEGKKVELITRNPKAYFSVVKPYAFIPSHFSHTTSACPATQFFASVSLEGEVSVLENSAEKAKGLNALMQKLQPEGHYETISETNPIYTKMLEATAVFYLKAKQTSFKLKMGQNLNKERKIGLIEELEKRGSALDIETVRLIRLYM